jgi:hypothetical protein
MNSEKRVSTIWIWTVLLFLAAGCSRTYRENQLIGSWQLDNPMSDTRLTYYTNHTWILTVISSDSRVPSGVEFGTWVLEGNRVSATTQSTLEDKAANVRETAEIQGLTDTALVLEGKAKSTFRKVDQPAAVSSDADCAQKLEGTWLYAYTNKAKLEGMRVYEDYHPGGVAFSRGTLYKQGKSFSAPNTSGTWRVDHGSLITAITNAPPDLLARFGNKESRDEIILVTDSQFSYRDANGAIKKVVRSR